MEYSKTFVDIHECPKEAEPENTVVQIMPADGWYLVEKSSKMLWEDNPEIEKVFHHTTVMKIVGFGVLATGKVVPLVMDSYFDVVPVDYNRYSELHHKDENFLNEAYAEGNDVFGIYKGEET